jgi:succinate dehydrogenase/fumarate reductase flavoprotein subunit
MPVDTDEPIVFKAKAVIIAAGCDGLRPIDYPTHPLTGDSVALGYKVGAQIIGQEFVKPILPMGLEPDPHWKSMYEMFQGGHSATQPGVIQKLTKPKINAEGDPVPNRGMSWACWLDVHYEVHAGRGPIKTEDPGGNIINVLGPGASGQSMQAGIYATDTDCSVGIKGLYAAGDSLGSQYIGASYSGFSFATAYANVTGARAGIAAAKYSSSSVDTVPDENTVESLKNSIREPIVRKGGFSPRWVTEILRNYMSPYFVMYIKHEKRLQAALMNVEFIRDHLVPKMVANDAHELRLVNETKNLVLVAEMKLRASLFRKESRGHHYREDYPQRNDPEWLAWTLLKDVDGSMEAFKKMIPEEWWPDLSKSYKERYPMELPTG